MFDRFKNRQADADRTGSPGGGGRTGNGKTAVAERPGGEPATRRQEPATRRTAGGEGVTRERMNETRARQREEYGGINWGAAFFGWLVAVGLGSLLLAIVAAAGAAVGLTQVSGAEAEQNFRRRIAHQGGKEQCDDHGCSRGR